MEVITYRKQIKIYITAETKDRYIDLDFVGNKRFKSELCIDLGQEEPDEGNVGICLEFDDGDMYQHILKIALVSKNGHIYEKSYPLNVFDATDFITKAELFDEANAYLVNDMLTVRVELKAYYGNKEKFETPSFETGIRNTSKFQKIFQAKQFTDVTIKIKDKTVESHKVLLAESSPVFYELLKDNNQNVLELKDLEFEVLEEMLNFIYGQKFNDFEKNARSLFIAAHEFKIDGLMQICQKYMFENLTTRNAFEMLALALDYCSGSELERECKKMIRKNIKNFVLDKNWDEFVKKSVNEFRVIFEFCVIKIDPLLKKNYAKPVSEETAKQDQPNSFLSHDFGKLYDESLFADVELIVQGKVLKAHKAILSSRSTVFKAMFSHDTLESSKNCVIIEDFDFETIQELLRFIYTEKVEKLKDVPLNLFRAADKYNLLKLKEICADLLSKNLKDENVIKILDVADMHSCLELKQEAIAFMARNIRTVIRTTSFVEMIRKKPQLFNQIFKDWVKKFY